MEINNNKLPKRKAKKTFMSVTGYFPSKKNSRSIFFESMLEKKLFLSLEFDENLLNYLEQPVIIEYTNKNRKTTYCPDCLINYNNSSKSKLVEVKYSSELIDREDELKIKFEQATLYSNENNLIFDIFNETSIEPVELKNIGTHGLNDIPFWYKNLISELLPKQNKIGRKINESEVLGAIKYLKNIGERVNIINIAEIVGCHPSIHKGFNKIYKSLKS